MSNALQELLPRLMTRTPSQRESSTWTIAKRLLQLAQLLLPTVVHNLGIMKTPSAFAICSGSISNWNDGSRTLRCWMSGCKTG
eukprot:5856733-Amphidinium_carterae.1